MSWSNWTPDAYSAQRREQVEEAASLARHITYHNLVGSRKRQDIRAEVNTPRAYGTEVGPGLAAPTMHGVLKGLALTLTRLRLRLIQP